MFLVTSKKLVDYIMKVYISVRFVNKIEGNFVNGPKHFFSTLRSTKKLSSKAFYVINKVLQGNVFCDDPENILIAMIHDPEQCVRKLG